MLSLREKSQLQQSLAFMYRGNRVAFVVARYVLIRDYATAAAIMGCATYLADRQQLVDPVSGGVIQFYSAATDKDKFHCMEFEAVFVDEYDAIDPEVLKVLESRVRLKK